MKCAICDGASKKIQDSHPGYVRGTFFNIYECTSCQTRHADIGGQTAQLDLVYDLIYKNGKDVPGYERYFNTAAQITNAKKPLEWLAMQEAEYWFVAEYLRENSKGVRDILEVGCGAGYLTYALRKEGYSATGIDLSQEVINRATDLFGEGFSAVPLSSFIDSGEQFDMVVMTEVVEHLPDPVDIINTCKQLLRPNGVIVLTTPNRDIYSSPLSWSVEAPPVHLWWFNRHGMTALANSCGLDAIMMDGSAAPDAGSWKKMSRRHSVNKFSVFDEDLKLISNQKVDRRPYRLGLLQQLKAWSERVASKPTENCPTLAASFHLKS